MKGAMTDPCVKTIKEPNNNRIAMTGSSQNFLRSRIKAKSSKRKSFIADSLSVRIDFLNEN
jgi:hypothetical protein